VGHAKARWTGGDIPGARDDLVDNLTMLRVITDDGAASFAHNRANETAATKTTQHEHLT
jgi:hypothetical protein